MDEWLMPGIPRTIAEEPDMETVRRRYASSSTAACAAAAAMRSTG